MANWPPGPPPNWGIVPLSRLVFEAVISAQDSADVTRLVTQVLYQVCEEAENLADQLAESNRKRFEQLKRNAMLKFMFLCILLSIVIFSCGILVGLFIVNLWSLKAPETGFTVDEIPHPEYFHSAPTTDIKAWNDVIGDKVSVPIVVEKNLLGARQLQLLIQSTIEFNENLQCVEVRIHPDEPPAGVKDYVSLTTSSTGCYSEHLGLLNQGRQVLNLDSGCWHKHILLHEFSHVVGLPHEFQRPNRDDYVEVHDKNIKVGSEDQYEKFLNNSLLYQDSMPFDFESITFYGSNFFSRNGKPTMTSKVAGKLVKENHHLSSEDVKKINSIYSCPGAPHAVSNQQYQNKERVTDGNSYINPYDTTPQQQAGLTNVTDYVNKNTCSSGGGGGGSGGGGPTSGGTGGKGSVSTTGSSQQTDMISSIYGNKGHLNKMSNPYENEQQYGGGGGSSSAYNSMGQQGNQFGSGTVIGRLFNIYMPSDRVLAQKDPITGQPKGGKKQQYGQQQKYWGGN